MFSEYYSRLFLQLCKEPNHHFHKYRGQIKTRGSLVVVNKLSKALKQRAVIKQVSLVQGNFPHMRFREFLEGDSIRLSIQLK